MWINNSKPVAHPRRYKIEHTPTTFLERVGGWLKGEGWNLTKRGLPIEVPFGHPDYDQAPYEESILWDRVFLESQNQADQ